MSEGSESEWVIEMRVNIWLEYVPNGTEEHIILYWLSFNANHSNTRISSDSNVQVCAIKKKLSRDCFKPHCATVVARVRVQPYSGCSITVAILGDPVIECQSSRPRVCDNAARTLRLAIYNININANAQVISRFTTIKHSRRVPKKYANIAHIIYNYH